MENDETCHSEKEHVQERTVATCDRPRPGTGVAVGSYPIVPAGALQVVASSAEQLLWSQRLLTWVMGEGRPAPLELGWKLLELVTATPVSGLNSSLWESLYY